MEYSIAFISDVAKLIDKSQPVFCDTETVGLYGKIRLIQFYQKHWARPVIVEWPSAYDVISLIGKGVKTVWHNAHYDISTLQDQIGKSPFVPEDFDCTFLLSRLHFYDKQKFSLDAAIEYVIGHNPYPNKKEMQGKDWGVLVLPQECYEYAASDVVYLSQVYDIVRASADTFSYKLDMLTLKDALEFQCVGLCVDQERLEALYAKNMARIKEINLPINCNSYKQVRPYIGSNSSDDEGLALLAIQGNERAKNVREVRKLTKMNSFLDKFQTPDGQIYGKFSPSARSGRFTCKDQNLQQLPRATKGVFGFSTDDDYVMVFSDFSQLELRCMCAIAADRTMERLMRSGEDMHGYTTKMCITNGGEYTKPQRQVGKTANFNLGYGGGPNMLRSIILTDADILVSVDECAALSKKWKRVYTGIAAWQEKGIKDWRSGRVWQTPLGRRYTAELMTDQLNIQIQGFGAEVAKLARHYMKQKFAEQGLDPKQMNFVHDSYILKCPKDPAIYEAVAKIVGDSMVEAWVEMCTTADLVVIKDLPMPVEVQVGYNWGDIEKGECIYEYKC